MKREDIKKMAHDIIDKCAVESDYIEYKKSADIKDSILKTACAYCNNYMNREIGLILIGVEEVDDKEIGIKGKQHQGAACQYTSKAKLSASSRSY